MSIDTQPPAVSPASTSPSTSASSPTKLGETPREEEPESKTKAISPTLTQTAETNQAKEPEKQPENSKQSAYNPTTLLTALLSPFTSSPSIPTPPEPYYSPTEIPLFKRLQKTRLSRTREKQLLRAAERDYNDPPPQPAPGDCCGSSCDPCVRDLWGEEIGVWRGRWGDRGVEGGKETGEGTPKGESSVKGKGSGHGNKGRKDLDW